MRRGTEAAIGFGEALRSLRTDHKLSMRQVGFKFGVDPTTIYQFEHGKLALKKERVTAYAEALGVGSLMLHDLWDSFEKMYPETPIVRRAKKTTPRAVLVRRIEGLIGPDRDRVMGYIDALLETSKERGVNG